MSSWKQNSMHSHGIIPDQSHYHKQDLPLRMNFRSRDSTRAAMQDVEPAFNNQKVKWRLDQNYIINQDPISTAPPAAGVDHHSANKENVKTWLNQSSTTSPTSVIQQAHRVILGHETTDPPSPSPICSPSPSSPISSPRPSVSMELQKPSENSSQNRDIDGANNMETNNSRTSTPDTAEASSSYSGNKRKDHGIRMDDLHWTSRRHGKDIASDAPPDSPTGSSYSSTSEGGLLALLASKLFSYREGRGSSRYARERSGPIDEKHVMEDRRQKPPVEEIFVQPVPDHPQPDQTSDYTTSAGSLYRTASEAASELSLGSANDRTLSMEFDAMLAAAVVAGVNRANTSDNTPEGSTREQHSLPEIQEDSSLGSSFAADQQRNSLSSQDGHAISSWRTGTTSDRPTQPGCFASALTVMRQGRGSDDLDSTSVSEMHLPSSRSSSHGSRSRADSESHLQIVPTTTLNSTQSMDDSDNIGNNSVLGSNSKLTHAASSGSPSALGAYNRDSLALVLVDSQPSQTSSYRQVPSQLHTTNENISSNSARCALEKVRRNKVHAQALAYQNAKNSKYNNRYKRDEAKINAWENQQKINATISMKKVEMKLEAKRAKALEKMQNEIASAHKKAEQKKASAEAVRAAKSAKAAIVAESIKKTGKTPSAGCFPF